MPVKSKRLIIPKFSSEQAEAEWFDRNMGRVQADIGRRIRVGDTMTLAQALRASAAREKAALKPVTIRMLPDDLQIARILAGQKGLPYQTYVKMLLREAMRRELAKQRRRAR